MAQQAWGTQSLSQSLGDERLRGGRSRTFWRRRRTCCSCCREALETWLGFRRWQDWLQGEPHGQLVSLVVGAVVLILSGTAVWSSVGGDPNAGPSWEESMWMSWGLFFDPGTQTGVAANAPIKVKLAALVFSVLGFLYNLTFLGIIVEWIRSSMDTWTRTQSRVWFGQHVLVLGWSEKTLYLIHELFEACYASGQHRRVVVLADRDPAEMHREIQQYFLQLWEHMSFFDRRWRMLSSLKIRQGIAHDTDALDRAGAVRAEEIIILSRDGDPQAADLETTRIMVALSSMRQRVNCRIFTEAQVQEVGKVLRRLHGKIEVIHARAASNHVLSLLATNHLIGACFADLCSFTAGDELYVVDRQTGWDTFQEACSAFDKAVCIGVQAAKQVHGAFGTRIELAPPGDRLLVEGERLLVMASDWQDVQLHVGSLWHWRGGSHGPSMTTRLMAGNTAVFMKEPKEKVTDDTEKEIRAQAVNPIIVVGWPADLADILVLLDTQVPKGTKVFVLSERSEAKRAAAITGGHRKIANLDIEHRYGPRTSGKCLRDLPLKEASAILILAEMQGFTSDDPEEVPVDDDVGDDTLTSDSVCLASLLVIADILEDGDAKLVRTTSEACELCRGVTAKTEVLSSTGKKTKIICEVVDPRTEQVVARNASLQDTAFFFRSKALETGIFTMAMSEPAVFNTLMVLMSPSCPSLQAVPVEPVLQKGGLAEGALSRSYGALARASWRELNETVKLSGGLLVGWHQRSQGLRFLLTPSCGKDEPVAWHAGDLLLVILQPDSVFR
ncbi:unnamed protein product [Symbiodinium microadriaticum]|nr:unnamed protein product [Symbiodinium sp. KB8]CAE7598075.1 unnamed protein product [Symbiodinium microadriaticum]